MYQEKRLIGKKYFMYFENTKILRLNVFKNKIHVIFFKATEIQNSILFLKLYSKNMITYMCVCVYVFECCCFFVFNSCSFTISFLSC